MKLTEVYRASTHRIGRDFLGVMLGASTRYDRAAGFFSSSVFYVVPEQFRDFFARGGKMRLVCSPVVRPDDHAAMIEGVFDHAHVLRELKSLEKAFSLRSPAVCLKWLIASGALEVKVALPRQGAAIYHEKIGVLRDECGMELAFAGSANESATAWRENFERMDAFASWSDGLDRRRALLIASQFADLWSDCTDGLEVIGLDDAIRDRVLDIREDHIDASVGLAESASSRAKSIRVVAECFRLPATLELRPHQRDAIAAWAKAGGRGLLEMATGSGKTLTALALAARLRARMPGGIVLVVVAPYIHLVDQWCEEARSFGLRPIRCAEGRAAWEKELGWALSAANAGVRPVLSVVATMATLATPAFQAMLNRVQVPAIFIGDEAHNFGAPNAAAALPTQFKYRVGLSATPDRWMDEPGTEAVESYFGPVVYRYGLSEAILDGVLTPYRYHPMCVGLSPDELDEYLQLSRQLSRYLTSDDLRDGPQADVVLRLLLQRARIVGAAKSKIPCLTQILKTKLRDTHILIYCGDGQVEGPQDGQQVRQVEEVVRIVGVELGMTCASYTARTSAPKRRDLLRSFANGDVQVLVAIRCLDEGVDVPATRTAVIMASSTNPRQFVQRRGRVLRRSLGKERAEIYDMIAAPGASDVPRSSPEFPVVRRLLRTELIRCAEFAELAENGPVARAGLLDIMSHYELLANLRGGLSDQEHS